MIILEIIFLGNKTWFCLIKFNTRFLNMFCEIFSKIFLLSSRKISAAADEAGKGGSKNGGASKGGGPGKASMPAPSNMAAFRATLWTNLDQVSNPFYLKINLS